MGKKLKLMYLSQLLDIGSKRLVVISGVPLSVSMEEIKTELKGGKVLGAKHITTKRNGEKAETVIINFEQDLQEMNKKCYARLLQLCSKRVHSSNINMF